MQNPLHNPQEARERPVPPLVGAPDVRPDVRVWLSGFLLAVQFLTVLRVPAARAGATRTPSTSPAADTMVPALPWFPVVGCLLGGALALLDWLCGPLLQPALRSVALLAVLAILTGGLHLDGFIDCCDGLFTRHSIERRLEIMRDSRVGAYGVVGGVLLILAQYVALSSLTGSTRVLGLIAAPLLGRWSMVYAVVRFPYQRVAGLGGAFRGSLRHLVAASVWGGALLIGTSMVVVHEPKIGGVVSALLLLLTALVTAGWTQWASRRLDGGLTGDTYGALNELVTLVTLVAMPGLLSISARV
jgi:adenosylcobinamide-GDP ribazoletransferase